MNGVGVCDVVRVGDCYTARIEYTKEVSPVVGPQFWSTFCLWCYLKEARRTSWQRVARRMSRTALGFSGEYPWKCQQKYSVKYSTEKALSKTRILFVLFEAQLGVDAEMRCIIFEIRQSWQDMTTSPKFALALYFFMAMAGSRWSRNSEESLHLQLRAKKPKPRACIVTSHGSRTQKIILYLNKKR